MVTLRKEPTMAGEGDKISGKAKQAAGDLTGDEDLEREGERDEAAGKTKDMVDNIKDKANDAVDSAKDALK